MVTINYYKNKLSIFDLSFNLREYIPDNYFTDTIDFSAEIRFYIDLFNKNNILKDSGTIQIWSICYKCVYDEIPFQMIYDEDYGFVHFYVEIPEDKVKVAKALKNFVEATKHHLLG